MTRLLLPEDIERAADALRAGEPVAMPTETVYGLAADVWSPEAVSRVFSAKGRPADDPLIVHISPGLLRGLDVSAGLAALGLSSVDPALGSTVDRLAAAFWPGPLTLVLPRGPRVHPAITAGLPDVAIRMPAHPLALALIDHAGRPLVAPSANRFGRISPTTAQAVLEELGGRIGFVLDGGPCAVGVESTVLRVADAMILRPGLISAADLTLTLGRRPTLLGRAGPGPQPSPGLLASHYAPRTPLRLAHTVDPTALAGLRAGWLVWSSPPPGAQPARCLAPSGDPAEAARNLYAGLRELDAAGLDLILAELPPGDDGLSLAIADRLRRAAAPRAP